MPPSSTAPPPTAAPSAPTAAPAAKTSSQALSNYNNFAANMQNPSQMETAQENQLGVPQAQQQVSGLRQAITNTTNLLNSIPSSVEGRTGQSLVTDAQASKQIGNEQAPISQNLTKEGTDLTNDTSDLNTLLSRAGQQTSLEEQGQTNQLDYLKNIYDALFGSEQAKVSQQQEQAKLQEQIREANMTDATNRASAGSLSSLLGGSGGSSTSGSSSSGLGSGISLRVPGNTSQGFAFKDSKGNTANALQYSQANQIPFRTLLSQMAAKGDTGAKAALGFIGNDGNADPTKVTSPQLASLYKALTGRNVAVYKAPVKAASSAYSNFVGHNAR